MSKWRIETDNDDQQWLDSFNRWNISSYKLGKVIELDYKDFSNLKSAVVCFNNSVAKGPAIYLVEV